MRGLAGVAAALAMVPGVAAAQDAPQATPAPSPAADDDSASDEPDIIVQGSRNLPGAVIGDIPPEEQLGPADIRSYGVGSISDLLTELSPLTESGRGSGGAPVVLLNGKRISSFAEIRDIPTEAIARVDILPEEVSLKYGYRADQRVVNVVLRRRFRATTVELADRLATEGGRNSPQAELDLLTIRNGGRLNLHAEYQASSALTEAERDITAVPSPFAFGGNVVGANGGAIDPALGSATIAGFPASGTALTDFAATAGRPNITDPAAYRTLLSSSRDFKANAVYARSIGKVSATINGTIDVADSRRLNGLETVALGLPAGNPFSPFAGDVTVDRALDGYLPLRQRNSSVTAHLGTTANGQFGSWNWSLTGNYDRSDSETFTDTGIDSSAFQARLNAGDPAANPFGVLLPADLASLPGNRAFSTSSAGGIDALFNGSLFKLPAGPVSTSVRIGGQTTDFDSRSFRGGITQTGQVSRDFVNGQVNVDVPITSESKDFLGAIGTLSVNFNLAADRLSDFGTLTTIGYGANWAPVDGVRLIASVTDQDDAPTPQQLGNPTITTPNARIFDYVTGTTATVTTLSGGNPLLIADNRHVTKLGLTLKPWKAQQLTITANYTASSTDNPIASFPSATAAIEAAFPGRFTRDVDGDLTRIDTRPINFAQSSRSQLRWGFNFSKPLKSKVQKEIAAFRAGTGPNPFAGLQLPGGRRRTGGDGADRPRGGGGRGGFGGGGGRGGGGRLQFALFHTWHLTDRVLIANGGPSLDLLSGDAIGASGGQARHELEGQAGYTNNGLGARLSVNYRTGTRVNGGTPATPEALAFSGLATANLRLFGDLGGRLDWVKAHPFLRGTRVTFSIDNLFDSRQRVTDASGTTPISYQPDYLDPLGRTVRLSIRKLF